VKARANHPALLISPSLQRIKSIRRPDIPLHASPSLASLIGTVTIVKSRGTAPARSSPQVIGVETEAHGVGRTE
jgi:hypothetical protein